ncbi:MAG TPA: carboxypeptidase-like regulatory domain-containing protein [Bacteroidales bacterium]|nr:carboxypeptidase-like regulatory domain-containing protein [Bacteroidales bacterium]
MLQRLLLLTVAMAFYASIFAQSGTFSGTVKDAATGEPIPFANVSVEENGRIVTGGMTDFDGKFSIKPIPAGKYTVKASYVGYATLQYNNVQIPAGKITFQDFDLKASAEILQEVEIKDYKVPLIAKDQTESGGTVTSEDIAKMPGRSATAVATTVAGVYSEDGEVGSIRGARSEGTVYYVDGVKVRGSSSIPKSAIEQVTVITGGLAAKYGDATGGIISVTTKGPTSKYYGGAEFLTSQFLDPYGYNLGGVMLSGPIWTIEEKGTNRKRTVAGFLISGEVNNIIDDYPSAVGVWRAKPEVVESIRTNPLRLVQTENGAIIYQNADYLGADAFTNEKTRPDAENLQVNLAGKIDFQPVRNLNLTFGGTMDYRLGRAYSRSNDLFNSSNNGAYAYNNWRVYGRLTQKFDSGKSDEEEDNSVIRNAYYTIQVDYSKTYSNYFDRTYRDNFFQYGHVGTFQTDVLKFYNYGVDTVANLEGWLQEVFVYAIDTFIPSTYNEDLAIYSTQFFDYFSDYSLLRKEDVELNGGLLNGQSAPSVYGLWASPGNPYTSYTISDATQFRVSASGTADIKDHEISFGFEFEQRNDSYYGLAPFGLWSLARKLMNYHINEKDLANPIIERDANGVYLDTINYPRLYNAETQSTFDKNFRTYLGYDITSLNWIDIDSYDPDQFDISYFSADELFNQGNNYVAYYGYDHTGKKLNNNATIEDFFTQTDANGVLTRPIPSFQPNYIAGYIQDKFAFKDLIFNIGLRVDRYDANQKVLKDQFLFSEAYTVGDNDPQGLIAGVEHPSNIPDNAVVYVNDLNNPSGINGYRVGNVWYDAAGTEVSNPNRIASANGIAPYLIDKETELSAGAFEDYKPQLVFMPRISFSFPISDEALFFAHYDILSKRPTYYNRLDLIEYYFIRQKNGDILNNPNLKTEKTIDYELGFQQKLGNTSSLKLSAFYREMRDMQQAVAVYGAYPVNYYTYGNIDFGTVKGFTASYDLRRTGNVTMRVAYTLQFANGTGSNVESAAAIIKSDQPNLRTSIPLDFDQRHNIAITVDYRFGGKVSGTPYDGPRWFGADIFANTGVNFVINSGSGSPYTKYDKPTNGSIVGSLNGSRKPWRTSISMRLDRDIRVKLASAKEDGRKDKYGYLNVYLDISNLLNAKNVLSVYSYTGNPDDDGYLNFSENQSQLATQNDEEAYRNYYSMLINSPYNYTLPRTIRLGVQFSF